MSLIMTPDEREAFLATLRLGLMGLEQKDRAPLAVPVWSSYTPGGELHLTTLEDSRKAQALRAAGRFSLCAQAEAWPYAYVWVEGAVLAIEAVDVERDLRPLARRYLGNEGGDKYVAEIGGNDAARGSFSCVYVHSTGSRQITRGLFEGIQARAGEGG